MAGRRDAFDGGVILPGVFSTKKSAKSIMSLRRSRQAGNVDRKNVQAIVQVGPEQVALHELLELAVGAVMTRTLVRMVSVAPTRSNSFLLQYAQQLDLRGRAQVADLVQKYGAAAGQLRSVLAHGDRPGKGAFFVRTVRSRSPIPAGRRQLTLMKAFEERFAVVMNGVRHQLLAGAAFAADQDRGVAFRDLAIRVENMLHALELRRCCRPEAFAQFLLQSGVLLLERALLLHGAQADLHAWRSSRR